MQEQRKDYKNIVIRAEFPEDLIPFFPDYVIRYSISSLDRGKDIIFAGSATTNNIRKLENISNSYICIKGRPDIDLTDKVKLIEFVYEKYGRVPPKYLISNIESYDMGDLKNYALIYWTTGKWPFKLEENSHIFELFQSLSMDLKLSIHNAILCCKELPAPVVTSSVLSFILRAKDIENQTVSPQYKRVLKSFYRRSGSKIKKAVQLYADSSLKSEELKLIELIYNLK